MGIISKVKSAVKKVKSIITGKNQTGAVLNFSGVKTLKPTPKPAPKPTVISGGKTYYGEAGKKEYERQRALLPSRKVEVIGVSNKKPASNESDYNVISRNFASTPGSTAKKSSGGGGGSSNNKRVVAPDDPSLQFRSDTGEANPNWVGDKGKPIMTATSTLLRQGVAGPNIAKIQAQLGITSDGIFGPQTKSAIMKFQQDNGLTVDGVVGPQTLAALQGATGADTMLKQGDTFTDPAGRTGTVNFSTTSGARLSAGGYTPLNPTQPKNKQTEIDNYNDPLNAEAEATANALAETNANADISTSASQKMLDALSKMVENRPEAPKSQAEILAKKRKELAIDPLERKLNEIDERDARLDAEREDLFAKEDNRQVSVMQINRRKSQEQIQYENEKRLIAVERNSVANELKQKYDVLDSFMKYKQMDYENANNSYNTQFSQAISMINLVKGIEDDKKSDKERAQDNAKGNLTLMLNQLKDKNWSSVDSVTRANIAKMELQSGLPVGSFVGILSARDVVKPSGKTGSSAGSYKVRDGDTFNKLATKFGTTVEALRNANLNVDENNLRIGDIIKIPKYSASKSSSSSSSSDSDNPY